jgi:hypothetical protein
MKLKCVFKFVSLFLRYFFTEFVVMELNSSYMELIYSIVLNFLDKIETNLQSL